MKKAEKNGDLSSKCQQSRSRVYGVLQQIAPKDQIEQDAKKYKKEEASPDGVQTIP